MSVNYTHTIKCETVRETYKQLWMALTNGRIDPNHLNLGDLALQVEVSKVRELADGLDLFYMSSDWCLTSKGDVEVSFFGLMTDADVMRLKLAVT